MKKRILRNAFVFILVWLVGFSNLPYDFFIKTISLYQKSHNIVDKLWHLGQDGNIVDNLTPLYKFAESLKVPYAKALTTANGDGIITYGISANTTPQWRTYSAASNSFGAQTATIAGGTGTNFQMRTSPTKQEAIAAYTNASGVLQVMCYNGTSWTNEWSVTAGGTGTTRRFDIAYETNTGDVIVVYSRNAAATNAVDYRTKAGSTGCGTANWAAAASMPTTTSVTTGTVHWVKMDFDGRASSNLIGAIWADSNADLGGVIWNGTAFVNLKSIEISLEVVTAAQDVDDFELQYESLSGDLMVVWANSAGANGTNGSRYMTCTGGTSTCAWGAATAIPLLLDDATNLDLSSNPNTDELLFSSIGNAGSDLQSQYWSGTAWLASCTLCANTDTASATPLAGTKLVSVSWLISGATTRGVVVYNDSATTNIGWYTFTGTAFTVQTDFTVAPVFGNPQKWYDLQKDPFNKDRLIFTVSDLNNDVFAKRLIMTSVPGFTWTNADGSAALQATLPAAIAAPFQFRYWRFIPSAVNTLTIGVTAGAKAATLNSGDTAQPLNSASCTTAATCAAFTLLVDTTSVTVSSIKITKTAASTVADADLSYLDLYYDATTADYSNGTTLYGTAASFTAGAATVSGSLALTVGTTYYFYVLTDVKGASTYPKGGQGMDFQIAANADVTFSAGSATNSGAPVTLASAASTCATATQTCVKPNATATTFGSGLADGGRSGESITISGFGFGVAPVGSRGNCAGAVDTGCARFTVGGAATVDTADVTSWSNISVAFTINAALASEGGTLGLQVVAGSQSDATQLTFFIYPNITSMVTCAAGGDRDEACPTNEAEEYAASDTFGLIQLNGDHFGSSTGTVLLRNLRSVGGDITATIHTTAEGPCSTGAPTWSTTQLCVQVSTLVDNNDYDGSAVVQRAGDSKDDTISLHILPRITSNSPNNGEAGVTTITINGNHFCQSGTCPTTLPDPGNSSEVYFGATEVTSAADFIASCAGSVKWSDTCVTVRVPSGTSTGSQKTIVQSQSTSGRESQRQAFNVNSSVPHDPSSLQQYKSDGSTVISSGAKTNETTVVLKFSMSGDINMTIEPQVEVVANPGTFTGTPSHTGTALAYTGTPVTGSVTVSGLSQGAKQWKARTKNTSTLDVSNWVSFGGSDGVNDFVVDSIAPTISWSPTDTCAGGQSNLGTNGVTITWTLNETADGQIEYSKNADLSASTNYPSTPNSPATSHIITLQNLDSGILYYYRAKSTDDIGNLATKGLTQPATTTGSYCTFTTTSISNKAGKTATFHVAGATGTVTNASPGSYSFTVQLPETSPTIKSAFVDITGTYTSGATSKDIAVQVNAQTAKTYVIPASSTSHFRIVYEVTSLALDPSTNALTVTPQANTTVFINSADVHVTYEYTP